MSTMSIVSITFILAGCQSQAAKIYIENSKSKMKTQLERVKKLRKKVAEAHKSKNKKISPANWEKTSGIILRLLERAEQTLTDTLPKARFDWERHGYTSPENMIVQADGYLKTLNEGQDPLHGKFAEPGGTVIDHCIIKKNGVYHLFYIRGKAATHWPESPTRNFGHATSKDLINWEFHEPVVQSPEKGWDEYQVWPPHIVEKNGEFLMLYTGVNYPCCQSIGLAKSKDLVNWKDEGFARLESCLKTPPESPFAVENNGKFFCFTQVTLMEQSLPLPTTLSKVGKICRMINLELFQEFLQAEF